MNLSDIKATLSFSNGSPEVALPVYKGSIGPDVIDIRKLYAQTGMFTYDPGFLSTASCESAITYIDGDKGELLYRGYPIDGVGVLEIARLGHLPQSRLELAVILSLGRLETIAVLIERRGETRPFQIHRDRLTRDRHFFGLVDLVRLLQGTRLENEFQVAVQLVG